MIRINKISIYIIFSFLVIFRLSGLCHIFPIIKYVYAGLEIGVLLITVIAMLLKKDNRCISFLFVLVSFFFIYNFINTLLKGQNILQIVSSIISDYTIYLITVICIRSGRKEQLIIISDMICKILLCINFIHMFIWPESFGFSRSMNKIYILASDNALIMYVIIFIIIHELRCQVKKYAWWVNVLFYGICAYELLIGEAATSYFVIAFLIVAIVQIRKINYSKYAIHGLVGILFLHYFILYVREFDFLSSIVEKFGKNLTFSGRTEIWDIGIMLAQKSLLTGYGVSDNTYYIVRRNVFLEAHNMLLSYILQGGMILLILFLLILISVCIFLWKNKGNVYSKYILVGIWTYLLAFLVESPTAVPGFFLLIGMCTSNKQE